MSDRRRPTMHRFRRRPGFGSAGAALLALLLRCALARAEETVLLEQGSPMRYLPADAGSGLALEWTAPGFDDTVWSEGSYGVGYGAGGMILTAVPEGTLSVFTRARFTVPDASLIESLHFGADFDDGVIAWINGVEIARRSMPVGDPAFDTEASDHESSNGDVADYGPVIDVSAAALPALVEGENVLAVGVWNVDGGSSDLALVPFLSANRPGPIDGETLCGTFAGEARLLASKSPYVAVCDLVVPSGSTLTIEPGVEVRFREGVGMHVEGRLVASGEPDAPILLAAVEGEMWGGITIDHGGDGDVRDSVLRHCVLAHGDTLLTVDDTGESPVVVEDCAFDFWDGNAVDCEGSHGLVLRRCDFGMSTPRSESDNETIHAVGAGLLIEHCTFGPRSGYNDVLDISDSSWGGPVPTVRYNVFLGGDDDAIDYDNADGWIIGNLVMDHWPRAGEGSSANGGGITGDAGARPVIAKNIVYRCYHGIGFKDGAEPLIVNNLVLDGNVGITFYGEDCSDSPPHGVLQNNIVWNNRDPETGDLRNVVLHGRWWSQYCQDAGDQGTAELSYNLIEGGWEGTGNVDLPPLIADPEGGDFSLDALSPALDRAFGGPFVHEGPDPAELAALLGVDFEGQAAHDLECVEDAGAGEVTYRDLGPLELVSPDPCGVEGSFVRGDANRDGAVDVSDPIFVLLVLFGERPASRCPDASDADDDGSVSVTDAVAVLDLLFREGPALPAPFPNAGEDPTGDDALGCR